MTRLEIDFVSDVVCPWCVIGLGALRAALARNADVEAEIVFHPFELNPHMPREGQNIVEHVAEKYGATPERSEANRARIREAAAAFGFTMNGDATSRIYNSFDAHRLLDWARDAGAQAALKDALFRAYFTDRADIGDPRVLAATAAEVGLDRAGAEAVLGSDAHAEAVRAGEAFWHERGIAAVPSIIFDDRYLVQGAQPVEVFERVIRKLVERQAATA
ncbi:MAG: disulfide bond formation protein DsbA [Proteobacteria bacterium SG_bin5]|nr:DsbA family oxidoreductase [Sphingomonas sp.]OQW41561.1 MAG: disulfide bond formation protein DsbA [Proteobacteria bacterium SG_bin5]